MNIVAQAIEYYPLIVALLAVGAVAGLLAGLLGVGGGIVLVPAYFAIFTNLGFASDQLMQICVATSLATIVITSLRSLKSHHTKGAVNWIILRGWAPGLTFGAVIGVFAAKELSSEALTLIFASLALCVSAYMGLSKTSWQLRSAMPGLWGRLTLSPLVGGLSVLMGIGGGSFAVPIMTLCGRPIHQAVATSAGFGAVLAIPSVIAFMISASPALHPPLTLGYVNVPAFGITIAMTLLTAPLGAALAHRMDAKPLKRIFAVFLFLVAANMLRGVLF